MTQEEARDVVMQIKNEAEKAFEKLGRNPDYKECFLLGFMESAFESYLSRQPVYDRTNDN